MAGKRNSLHPSFSVTNIKNHIPIQLELETGLYSTWSKLFQTHCKAYRVLDHIVPNTAASDSSSTPVPDKDEWEYVDAHVLMWIYGSISRDLLTIISKADTAQKAWDNLRDIFQDNKTTRALNLEEGSYKDIATKRIENREVMEKIEKSMEFDNISPMMELEKLMGMPRKWLHSTSLKDIEDEIDYENLLQYHSQFML